MSERMHPGDCFGDEAPKAPETPQDERLRPSKLLDQVYEFKGYHGADSACRVRIFGGGGEQPPVIVFTEMEDNPGTSVTNMSEFLAAETVAAHFPERFEHETAAVFLEHYPERVDPVRRIYGKPDYDLITYRFRSPRIAYRNGVHRLSLGTPRWTPVTPTRVARLIAKRRPTDSAIPKRSERCGGTRSDGHAATRPSGWVSLDAVRTKPHRTTPSSSAVA